MRRAHMVAPSLTILIVPTALYKRIFSVHCAQLTAAPMRRKNLQSLESHVIPQETEVQSNNLEHT